MHERIARVLKVHFLLCAKYVRFANARTCAARGVDALIAMLRLKSGAPQAMWAVVLLE